MKKLKIVITKDVFDTLHFISDIQRDSVVAIPYLVLNRSIIEYFAYIENINIVLVTSNNTFLYVAYEDQLYFESLFELIYL